MAKNHIYSWRRRTKKRMVASFGGKCCVCKKNYPQELFEFHHLDPAEKLFGIGTVKSISWNRLVEELRKCIMVCANCHRLIEYGHIKVPKKPKRFNESFADYKNKPNSKKLDKCACGKDKPADQKFCSRHCYHSHKRKVNWPNKQELKRLLRTESLNSIGKLYGVTHGAVSKWKRYYNL